MLTYDLTNTDGSLYKAIYQHIKDDICSGKLSGNDKMPSKRTLADNLGVSTITVENAYDQLIAEGYLYTIPKKGYYVSDISDIPKVRAPKQVKLDIVVPDAVDTGYIDLSSNRTDVNNFPFSIWARLMRETISLREKELLTMSFCAGVEELRSAIAGHLASFRGMAVDPDQIIVGAGTEYLYGLLCKLLGNDNIYCIENPGYSKVAQIYESNGAECRYADMDDKGISVDRLMETGANIAHISPTHHFPTGITMPISRRYELLAWASQSEDRYIIEDDYDSEFRLNGQPIPPLMSIDACEKVIYINTFSKSLTSTIRIAYMVLPAHLANLFYRKLSFYSCTVSTFEQYTLAAFIDRGYFEKHINRMRLHYGRKRAQFLEALKKELSENECRVIENDSGLHFIMEVNTGLSDRDFCAALLDRRIRIRAVTDYYSGGFGDNLHRFILNYSGLDAAEFKEALQVIKELCGH